ARRRELQATMKGNQSSKIVSDAVRIAAANTRLMMIFNNEGDDFHLFNDETPNELRIEIGGIVRSIVKRVTLSARADAKAALMKGECSIECHNGANVAFNFSYITGRRIADDDKKASL